jgi:16S rRNA (adenine1518-N6/adenine1519-N6)-dimethyltransferase
MDENSYFETIAQYKLLAKHEVGQNFLIDQDVAKRIVSLAHLKATDRVLEIGSGAGSLSFFLAQSGAEADLIDIDEGLVLKLQQDFAETKNIHALKGNVMRWDLAPYGVIIGNLPYYITSGILEKVLLEASSCQRAVFMVQKEVVARLNAPVGSEDYGPLPILLRYRAAFEKGFTVSRNAFTPAPHVDSAVFALAFSQKSSVAYAQKLYAFVSALFLHRRKTLLNNLGAYLGDNERALQCLQQSALEARLRPEDVSLEGYEKLLSQLN